MNDDAPSMLTLPALPGNARVDLHMHSDLSDGRYSPAEVLQRCAAAGLSVVALTDHDLPSALPFGPQEVDGHPITVLHACEVSGVYEGHELHLLVYFPGQMPAAFAAFLREQARGRAQRYEAGRAALGLEGVPPADAAALAGERSLTRRHLSQALAEAGHARSVREAFTLWTGDAHGTVPHVELELVEAIRVARAHGGLTSWAHPNLAQAQAWTKALAAEGLQGIEGLRPGMGKAYRKSMRGLARKSDLVLTGGSDWHGWGPKELGAFAVDAQQAAPFLKALFAA